MELSIVTTLYKSRPFLDNFIRDITKELDNLSVNDYELVFVNDGSPDDSLSFLICQQQNNKHIRIVDLARNFGHHYALQEGIKFASGNYVYIADNDLEVPASFLSQCVCSMREDQDLDMVYGVQEVRKGHIVERIGGGLFWSLFNKMSDLRVPKNIVTECLLSRKFVNQFLKMGDTNLFLAGMIHWVGLNKKELTVKKGLREGKSTYTFGKRMALMIQALTSFTGKPLEWLFYIGLVITLLSVLFIIYLIIRKLILGNAISLGWTSLIGINILILGIMTTFMGLIGMYVFRIYKQVQGRPNVIIKKIY